MKKLTILGVLILLVLAVSATASADEPSEFREGEILVKTGKGNLGWEVRQVPPGQERAEVASEKAKGNKAELNGIWYAIETIPNDPRFPEQYGPNRIKAPQAWDLSVGDAGTIISVIDTGVDCAHEDLADKCIVGWDFVNNDADPQDDHGHGTHVSGIAAAVTDNGIGVAGICWLCLIQPVKVLNSGGSGTWDQVASGIVWAADHGADVINMSLGGSGFSQVVQDAVAYAYNRGVLIFAAAGNTGGTPILYPARYEQVIAVAATDSNDNRALFSSYGPEVELSAPGVGNLSSVPTYFCSLCDASGYRSLSGTSMASPHAAGAGAVILSYLGLDNVSARALMQETAIDLGSVGRDQFYGFGLVDLFAALSGEVPPTPVPTEIPPTPTDTPIPPTPTEGPPPTETPTREPGTALCGKMTGGFRMVPAGSPYYLTCNVDIKGGLVAEGVVIELRGFALSSTGMYLKDVEMSP